MKSWMIGLIQSCFSSLQRNFTVFVFGTELSVAWYGYTYTAASVDGMQRNKLSDRAMLNVATDETSV